MSRLSEHFMLAEFTHSQTATRLGIDNNPGPRELAKLIRLCEKVLEPVRKHYGKPIRISSGYRSPALNDAIGGSKTSQHSKGEAADFEVQGVSNIDVVHWMHKNLNYDQLIAEFIVPGQPTSGWIHVSYREPYRNMELTAKRIGGRTKYLPGIVV